MNRGPRCSTIEGSFELSRVDELAWAAQVIVRVIKWEAAEAAFRVRVADQVGAEASSDVFKVVLSIIASASYSSSSCSSPQDLSK